MERGSIADHSMDITGAGSGVGRALAMQFKDCREKVNMWLIGGRRAEELQDTRDMSNAGACIAGELFNSSSAPYKAARTSAADVLVHCAAINLDTLEDKSQCDPLREKQNAFLERLIEAMKMNSSLGNHRLLVVVNSVTAFFEREAKNPGKYPYMRMKLEQADILSKARTELKHAGIELSVVYPGAIRTEMMRHLPDDQNAVRMANMFGKRLKNVLGKPDGLIQDRIFQPQEIAEALAKLINFFFVNGTIPESAKEWIMVNHEDLKLPVLGEA